MLFTSIVFITSQLMQPAGELYPRYDCIPGRHEPLRVMRLPGVSATTARPQNPLNDAWPHCYDGNGSSRLFSISILLSSSNQTRLRLL